MAKKILDFKGFLDSGEIEKLEDTALDILSKYGMSISRKRVINMLTGCNGVKIYLLNSSGCLLNSIN